MTLYQTFQSFFNIPVMEAIVEVHSYIIFFLFAIVTTFVLVALVLFLFLNYLFKSSSSPPQKSSKSGSGEGDGDSSSPDPDDWKRKLLLVCAVVGLTAVVLATAGKIGWGDYGACWNRPGEFFGAGLDHGMHLFGIEVDSVTVRKYLTTILPEVWRVAADPAVIAAKLEVARIPLELVPEFNLKLLELGTKKGVFLHPVLATYPQGACELTLRAALEVSVNDQIDTLILEYATGDFW